MINVGTKRGLENSPVEIRAPLLTLSKVDIIKRGLELKVPYEKTWSCYNPFMSPRRVALPDGTEVVYFEVCGKCDSCAFRQEAFKALHMTDPLIGKKIKVVARKEGAPIDDVQIHRP